MSTTIREDAILQEVRLHHKVLLPDLAEMLDVSVDTIRRDVKKLHREGKLKKIHGGAISTDSPPTNQHVYALTEKRIIATKAQQLIRSDQVLLISGGTTNVELARGISHKLRLSVFTPSLPVAEVLCHHPRIELIFIGGKVSKDSRVATGGAALEMLSGIKVDMCFMGTGYLDNEHGLTTMDWEVAQMKKAMIESSKRVAALTISKKLNSHQRYTICDVNTLDFLITELEPDDKILSYYAKQNLEIL